MTQIKITTDRLPQPERHKGAVLDVTPEKAASMAAQGFAEIIEQEVIEASKRKRGRPKKVMFE